MDEPTDTPEVAARRELLAELLLDRDAALLRWLEFWPPLFTFGVTIH